MTNTTYLETAEVIELHIQIMELTTKRSSQGIRDQDMLESAIAKPQMAAYYEAADIVRQATLLAIGISQNQPFVDGNKRTGYAAADVFLDINGFRYVGDPIDFARQLEAVAERTGSLNDAIDQFESWLRSHVSELDR